MHVRHARRRHRFGYRSIASTGFPIGCDGMAAETGPTSSDEAKAGARRKEVSKSMENRPPGGSQ